MKAIFISSEGWSPTQGRSRGPKVIQAQAPLVLLTPGMGVGPDLPWASSAPATV